MVAKLLLPTWVFVTVRIQIQMLLLISVVEVLSWELLPLEAPTTEHPDATEVQRAESMS